MHQVNPRFKPGGRKKLCDGLVAQDTTLLFLQVSRFYRLKKAQEKIDFCGAGGHPPHPPFLFLFYFYFNHTRHNAGFVQSALGYKRRKV